MPPPTAPTAPPLVCGFDALGVPVTEAALRDAVAAAAVAERSLWFVGHALQNESENARFGDLVRYWMAGNDGNGAIRPDTLVAVQQAAVAAGVRYGRLLDLDPEFHAAQRRHKTALEEVTRREGAVRLARTGVATAAAGVAAAAAGDKPGAEHTLNAARAALAVAERTLNAAQEALRTARATLDAEAARIGPRMRPDAVRVRRELLAHAPGSTTPANLNDLVQQALTRAHDSHANIGGYTAWSAVFVVACVRTAAIQLQVEAINGGAPQGANGLLLASFRHWTYVIEAYDRAHGLRPTDGTYHAFRPTGRAVQKGDIIVQDRQARAAAGVQSFDRIPHMGARNLHCDIVTEVRAGQADAIGGNLGDSVRRRRFPLDGHGALIVNRRRLYVQERPNGTMPNLPAMIAAAAGALPGTSTGRIFAVLSPVQRCVPAPTPVGISSMVRRSNVSVGEIEHRSPWPIPASARSDMASFDELESPFLNEEIRSTVQSIEPEAPLDESWRVEAEGLSSPYRDHESDEEEHAEWTSVETSEYEEESGHDDREARSVDDQAQTEEWDALASEEEDITAAEGGPAKELWDAGGSWEVARELEGVAFEEEADGLAPADTIDELAAQPVFPQPVRERPEPLLDARRVRAATTWNGEQHPAMSGIAETTLLARLGSYVDHAAILKAMQADAGLTALSRDSRAVLTVVAHQFQQKIYATIKPNDAGRIGEGVLDALGFVRHRGSALNAVDTLNVGYHMKPRSKAYTRIEEVFNADSRAFASLGADVSPKTWYHLFVNAPFLGRPFKRGIHVELLRRLRLAERWLATRTPYRAMSPVELGRALDIDEDHGGGRPNSKPSMHTLGLAVDIRYNKNPWVTGQRGKDGKPNEDRNAAFQAVTRNVSRLLTGTNEVLTPTWLTSLSSKPGQTTTSAYREIEQRHANLQAYLALENDQSGLGAAIDRQRAGAHPERVIDGRETREAAVRRWRNTIAADRKKLHIAFGGRNPAAGFLNLHHDLVVALRDHACLAWGAIDLGGHDNGDMMHFDCRATGIGWKLALARQRTTAASHPCLSRAVRHQELKAPVTSGATAPTPYLGGRWWAFTASTLPLRVGIFCPKAVAQATSVDVLVYAHGLLKANTRAPGDLITKPPFQLGRIVDASNRNIVLVVPDLDWYNLKDKGLNLSGSRPRMHRLGAPANLNGVVEEVLREIGRVFGSRPPAIKSLILAGHSRAYDFLNPLAMSHAHPGMSKGALGLLSEVWAFDTTYSCPIAAWTRWLQSKPSLRISVFYRDHPKTRSCGKQFESAVAGSGGRLQVVEVREAHGEVPAHRLPTLLNRAPASSAEATAEEFEEWLEEPAEVDAELAEEQADDFSTADDEAIEQPTWELDDSGARQDIESEFEDEHPGQIAEGDVLEENEAERALAWEHNATEEGELNETQSAGADTSEWEAQGDIQYESVPAAQSTRPVKKCKDDRCSSGYIRWMQTSLNTVLGTNLNTSGKLDAPTQRAVRRLKKAKRVKTREAYAGPAIESALIAAGASPPPPLAKAPCGVSGVAELVPLLNKYRGDVPLAFLMGWIDVESGRDLGSLTSICERGYFQLHPDESSRLVLDHDLVGTNADYSVAGGLKLVQHYRRTIDNLSKTYPITRGSDLYWRLLKLCHWIPSGPAKILSRMRAQGAEITGWESIRTFAKDHRDVLKDSIKRDPVEGLESVDRMFRKVDQWSGKLKKP